MTFDCCNDDDHQDDHYCHCSSGSDDRNFECIQGFQEGRGVIICLVVHIHCAPSEHRFVEIQLLFVPMLLNDLHSVISEVYHLSISRLDGNGVAVYEGGLKRASKRKAEFGIR